LIMFGDMFIDVCEYNFIEIKFGFCTNLPLGDHSDFPATSSLLPPMTIDSGSIATVAK
jgi:hypothetical protein